MGFYGNIKNTGTAPFSFDRIFSSRKEMEAGMASDGVYAGRYVLIEYDKALSNLDTHQGYRKSTDSRTGEALTLYKDSTCEIPFYIQKTPGDIENVAVGSVVYLSEITTSARQKFYITTANYETLIENVDTNITEAQYYILDDDEEKIFISDADLLENNVALTEISLDNAAMSGVRTVYKIYHNAYSFYECIAEGETTTDESGNTSTLAVFKYLAEYESGDSDSSALQNYLNNFARDSEYIDDRPQGYDSTVWQKVYIDSSEKYVMVAELNSKPPQITISAEAPSSQAQAPYFSTNNTDTVYDLHMPAQWGFRVKAADNSLSSLGMLDDDNYDSKKITFYQRIYNLINNYIIGSDSAGIITAKLNLMNSTIATKEDYEGDDEDNYGKTYYSEAIQEDVAEALDDETKAETFISLIASFLERLPSNKISALTSGIIDDKQSLELANNTFITLNDDDNIDFSQFVVSTSYDSEEEYYYLSTANQFLKYVPQPTTDTFTSDNTYYILSTIENGINNFSDFLATQMSFTDAEKLLLKSDDVYIYNTDLIAWINKAFVYQIDRGQNTTIYNTAINLKQSTLTTTLTTLYNTVLEYDNTTNISNFISFITDIVNDYEDQYCTIYQQLLNSDTEYTNTEIRSLYITAFDIITKKYTNTIGYRLQDYFTDTDFLTLLNDTINIVEKIKQCYNDLVSTNIDNSTDSTVNANNNTIITDTDIEQKNIKLTSLFINTLKQSVNLVIYSDDTTQWLAYDQNVPYYYDAETDNWTTDSTNTVPADIYFNKAGFDSAQRSYIEQDTIDNKISILPTGYGQTKNSDGEWANYRYNKDPKTLYGEKIEAPDTQELSIHLPAIGNTISDIWDIVYGKGTYDETTETYDGVRKTDISWDGKDNTKRMACITPREDGSLGYDTTSLETVAGVINSTQDLLGKNIIVDPYGYTTLESLSVDQDIIYNKLDTDHIYYLSNDGQFYRKKWNYNFDSFGANDIIDSEEEYISKVQNYSPIELLDPTDIPHNYFYQDGSDYKWLPSYQDGRSYYTIQYKDLSNNDSASPVDPFNCYGQYKYLGINDSSSFVKDNELTMTTGSFKELVYINDTDNSDYDWGKTYFDFQDDTEDFTQLGYLYCPNKYWYKDYKYKIATTPPTNATELSEKTYYFKINDQYVQVSEWLDSYATDTVFYLLDQVVMTLSSEYVEGTQYYVATDLDDEDIIELYDENTNRTIYYVEEPRSYEEITVYDNDNEDYEIYISYTNLCKLLNKVAFDSNGKPNIVIETMYTPVSVSSFNNLTLFYNAEAKANIQKIQAHLATNSNYYDSSSNVYVQVKRFQDYNTADDLTSYNASYNYEACFNKLNINIDTVSKYKANTYYYIERETVAATNESYIKNYILDTSDDGDSTREYCMLSQSLIENLKVYQPNAYYKITTNDGIDSYVVDTDPATDTRESKGCIQVSALTDEVIDAIQDDDSDFFIRKYLPGNRTTTTSYVYAKKQPTKDTFILNNYYVWDTEKLAYVLGETFTLADPQPTSATFSLKVYFVANTTGYTVASSYDSSKEYYLLDEFDDTKDYYIPQIDYSVDPSHIVDIHIDLDQLADIDGYLDNVNNAYKYQKAFPQPKSQAEIDDNLYFTKAGTVYSVANIWYSNQTYYQKYNYFTANIDGTEYIPKLYSSSDYKYIAATAPFDSSTNYYIYNSDIEDYNLVTNPVATNISSYYIREASLAGTMEYYPVYKGKSKYNSNNYQYIAAITFDADTEYWTYDSDTLEYTAVITPVAADIANYYTRRATHYTKDNYYITKDYLTYYKGQLWDNSISWDNYLLAVQDNYDSTKDYYYDSQGRQKVNFYKPNTYYFKYEPDIYYIKDPSKHYILDIQYQLVSDTSNLDVSNNTYFIKLNNLVQATEYELDVLYRDANGNALTTQPTAADDFTANTYYKLITYRPFYNTNQVIYYKAEDNSDTAYLFSNIKNDYGRVYLYQSDISDYYEIKLTPRTNTNYYYDATGLVKVYFYQANTYYIANYTSITKDSDSSLDTSKFYYLDINGREPIYFETYAVDTYYVYDTETTTYIVSSDEYDNTKEYFYDEFGENKVYFTTDYVADKYYSNKATYVLDGKTEKTPYIMYYLDSAGQTAIRVETYAPSKFYIEDTDKQYFILDSRLEYDVNSVYYTDYTGTSTITLSADYIQATGAFNSKTTYYDEDDNIITLSTYQPGVYYCSSTTNADLIEAVQLVSENTLNMTSSTDGVPLYRKYYLEPMKGFSQDYNTITGILLKLNQLCNFDDLQTRDLSTVSGTMNRLQDEIRRIGAYDYSTVYELNQTISRLQTKVDELSPKAKELLNLFKVKDSGGGGLTINDISDSIATLLEQDYVRKSDYMIDEDNEQTFVNGYNSTISNINTRLSNLETSIETLTTSLNTISESLEDISYIEVPEPAQLPTNRFPKRPKAPWDRPKFWLPKPKPYHPHHPPKHTSLDPNAWNWSDYELVANSNPPVRKIPIEDYLYHIMNKNVFITYDHTEETGVGNVETGDQITIIDTYKQQQEANQMLKSIRFELIDTYSHIFHYVNINSDYSYYNPSTNKLHIDITLSMKTRTGVEKYLADQFLGMTKGILRLPAGFIDYNLPPHLDYGAINICPIINGSSRVFNGRIDRYFNDRPGVIRMFSNLEFKCGQIYTVHIEGDVLCNKGYNSDKFY